jgi:hypothetical protein
VSKEELQKDFDELMREIMKIVADQGVTFTEMKLILRNGIVAHAQGLVLNQEISMFMGVISQLYMEGLGRDFPIKIMFLTEFDIAEMVAPEQPGPGDKPTLH